MLFAPMEQLAADERRPFCEAPRHAGRRIAATHLVGIDGPVLLRLGFGSPSLRWAACGACTGRMAGDLARDGKLPP